MTKFANEVALWNYIKPCLLGRHWRRLENAADAGAGDAYGFFRGHTHWLELKIGKPGISHLRASQHDFVIDCMEARIPVWLCFGWKDKVWFFKGLNFKCSMAPDFFRPELRTAVRLSHRTKASA